MAEAVVVHSSAMVEALIGTPRGRTVRIRLWGCELNAPAVMDAEVLSALETLARSGALGAPALTAALDELVLAPVLRHELAPLLDGARSMRDELRFADALYVGLATTLGVSLVTTDERLASASTAAQLV